MKRQDTYSEAKTYTYHGAIVRVYSPILSDAERQRRMAEIAKSAARLLSTVKQ